MSSFPNKCCHRSLYLFRAGYRLQQVERRGQLALIGVERNREPLHPHPVPVSVLPPPCTQYLEIISDLCSRDGQPPPHNCMETTEAAGVVLPVSHDIWSKTQGKTPPHGRLQKQIKPRRDLPCQQPGPVLCLHPCPGPPSAQSCFVAQRPSLITIIEDPLMLFNGRGVLILLPW